MKSHKYNNNPDNPELFEDIRELCIYCAKGIVIISQRHNENPRLVSRLFITVFNKIVDMVDNEDSSKS